MPKGTSGKGSKARKQKSTRLPKSQFADNSDWKCITIPVTMNLEFSGVLTDFHDVIIRVRRPERFVEAGVEVVFVQRAMDGKELGRAAMNLTASGANISITAPEKFKFLPGDCLKEIISYSPHMRSAEVKNPLKVVLCEIPQKKTAS